MVESFRSSKSLPNRLADAPNRLTAVGAHIGKNQKTKGKKGKLLLNADSNLVCLCCLLPSRFRSPTPIPKVMDMLVAYRSPEVFKNKQRRAPLQASEVVANAEFYIFSTNSDTGTCVAMLDFAAQMLKEVSKHLQKKKKSFNCFRLALCAWFFAPYSFSSTPYALFSRTCPSKCSTRAPWPWTRRLPSAGQALHDGLWKSRRARTRSGSGTSGCRRPWSCRRRPCWTDWKISSEFLFVLIVWTKKKPTSIPRVGSKYFILFPIFSAVFMCRESEENKHKETPKELEKASSGWWKMVRNLSNYYSLPHTNFLRSAADSPDTPATVNAFNFSSLLNITWVVHSTHLLVVSTNINFLFPFCFFTISKQARQPESRQVQRKDEALPRRACCQQDPGCHRPLSDARKHEYHRCWAA